jgi:hypothetical protein
MCLCMGEGFVSACMHLMKRVHAYNMRAFFDVKEAIRHSRKHSTDAIHQIHTQQTVSVPS